jgi:hypothetical protein
MGQSFINIMNDSVVDSSYKKPLCFCNSTLKLSLYEKYSNQTMIFWSFCAFIWFKNIEKNAVANDKWFFAT